MTNYFSRFLMTKFVLNDIINLEKDEVAIWNI